MFFVELSSRYQLLTAVILAVLCVRSSIAGPTKVYPVTPEGQLIFYNDSLVLSWMTSLPGEDILWCYWRFFSDGAWDEFLGYHNVEQNRLEISSWHHGWEYTNPASPCHGGIQRSKVSLEYSGKYMMVVGLHNQTEYESPEAEVDIIACSKPNDYDVMSNPHTYIRRGIPTFVYACRSDVIVVECNTTASLWKKPISKCGKVIPPHTPGKSKTEKALTAVVVIIFILIAVAIILYLLRKKGFLEKFEICRKKENVDDLEMNPLTNVCFIEAFGSDDEVMVVEEGKKIPLSVTLNKAAAVNFLRNGEPLPYKSKKRRTKHEFKVNVSDASMSGVYKCVVNTSSDEHVEHAKGVVVLSDNSSKPVFLDEAPDDLVLKDGDKFVYSFKVYGAPAPTICWVKDGVNIEIDGNYKSMLINDQHWTNASLIIENVTAHDTSTIKIIAANINGDIERAINLQVKSKPSVASDVTELNVIRGDVAQFTAMITANPLPAEAIWSIDGEKHCDSKLLKESECRGSVMLDFDTSILNGSRFGNPKKYDVTMTATNEEGPGTWHFKLKIREPTPPVFMVPFKDVSFNFNADVHLSAKVCGDPLPDIECFKDDKKIEEDDRVQIQMEKKADEVLVKVHISKCTLQDSGKYTLLATNRKDKKYSSGELTVLGSEPEFVEFPKDMYIIKGEKSDRVKVEAGGNPTPTLHWTYGCDYHEGIQVRKDRTQPDSKCTFEITKADTRHTGVYTVEARNDIDRIQKTFVVKVFGTNTLEVLEGFTDLTVNEGDDALFSAVLEGPPDSEMGWYLKDRHISSTNQKYIVQIAADEFMKIKTSLKIKQCEVTDSGNVCIKVPQRVYSDIVKVQAKLHVHVPATFVTKPDDITLDKRKKTAKATCKFKGLPEPQVECQNASSGEVIIGASNSKRREPNTYEYSVTLAEPGEYSIHIKNEAGEESAVFYVQNVAGVKPNSWEPHDETARRNQNNPAESRIVSQQPASSVPPKRLSSIDLQDVPGIDLHWTSTDTLSVGELGERICATITGTRPVIVNWSPVLGGLPASISTSNEGQEYWMEFSCVSNSNRGKYKLTAKYENGEVNTVPFNVNVT